jgi:hypothetical protein
MTCRLILIRVVQGLLFQSLLGIIQIDGFTNNFTTVFKAPVGSLERMQRLRLHPLQMKPSGKQTTGNKPIERRLNKDTLGDFYNDDAFGLIFLTSSLVIHDFFFCATFLSVTGVTATLVNAGKIKFSPLLPGFVGVGALVLRIIIPLLSSKGMIVDVEVLISSLVNSLGVIEYENYNPTTALIADTSLSSISLVWAFLSQRKE